jgi:hypothetical protein
VKTKYCERLFIPTELSIWIILICISLPVTGYFVWFMKIMSGNLNYNFGYIVDSCIPILGIISISGPLYLLGSLIFLFYESINVGFSICFLNNNQLCILTLKKFRISYGKIKLWCLDKVEFVTPNTRLYLTERSVSIIIMGTHLSLANFINSSQRS